MQLLHRQCGDEMTLLCGIATKNSPAFSELTAPSPQNGGNDPQYEEFKARTLWSLSNAFTSAFKELEPIPQFKATAKLSGFLEQRFSRTF
jgi:hypothetical protein